MPLYGHEFATVLRAIGLFRKKSAKSGFAAWSVGNRKVLFRKKSAKSGFAAWSVGNRKVLFRKVKGFWALF